MPDDYCFEEVADGGGEVRFSELFEAGKDTLVVSFDEGKVSGLRAGRAGVGQRVAEMATGGIGMSLEDEDPGHGACSGANEADDESRKPPAARANAAATSTS